jgi:DNA-binding response OmpR family regulator
VSTLNLAGRRIFVVEDEALLAWDICAQIEACGGVVIGPAMTLAAAHDALQENFELDGSVLDIRLGKEMVYPLIEPLEHAGVPVVFASSESREGIPSRYAHIPLFGKPIDFSQVAKQLFSGR